MFFAIGVVLLVLGVIETIYSFVKKGFKEGILLSIFNVGFALTVFFDANTLWFNIGLIVTFCILVIKYFVWYKKDEKAVQ
jgi:uncharacterized membrane protein HdeD (DUF308 family)